jgi:AraC family transcriptional regulator, positive regulator of tynA and feaB
VQLSGNRRPDSWKSWSTAPVRGDRIAFWSDVVVRGVINSEIEPLNQGRFEGELWSRTSGAFRFVNFRTREHAISRTVSQTRGHDGHVMIGLQCRGVSLIEQAGNRLRLETGQIAILDSNEPFKLRFPQSVERRLVLVPRARFAALTGTDVETCGPRALDARGGSGLAARRLIDILSDVDRQESEAACADLVDGLLCAVGGAMHPDRAQTRDARRQMARVRLAMRDLLNDADTDAQAVAAHAGLSVRSLHRLFASRGNTFSRSLQAMRLERAHDMVASGRTATLTEIAFMNGFSDLAHFSRSFRARFGMPPSAARAILAR